MSGANPQYNIQGKTGRVEMTAVRIPYRSEEDDEAKSKLSMAFKRITGQKFPNEYFRDLERNRTVTYSKENGFW